MAILNCFSTGGTLPDNLTATPSDVLEGYTFIGSTSDEPVSGTLKLTGNAVVNHVSKGATFYSNNIGTKLTGIMEVNNISNFSVAVSSGRNIIASWNNPSQLNGRPYSGVYIRYQTGSYPTPTTGTMIYKGSGTSSVPSVLSQVDLVVPNLTTTYYFLCYSYCITSNGELLGTQLKSSVTTGGTQIVQFTATQDYTIPAGYSAVDLFCVGGGSSGSSGYTYAGSGGGGSGYTSTVSNISVSTGQILKIIIGNSGTGYNGSRGGTTSIQRNNIVLVSAEGGYSNPNGQSGARGGSGGGFGAVIDVNGTPGESDGSGSLSQGRTTRAFGEAGKTVYAGGGGGGGGGGPKGGQPGAGGAGGGGRGGYAYGTAVNGVNGTGSAGGGDGLRGSGQVWGGTGIALIRLK